MLTEEKTSSSVSATASVSEKCPDASSRLIDTSKKITERDVLVLRHRLLLKEEEKVTEQLSVFKDEKANLAKKSLLMDEKLKYIEAKHENVQLQNELLKLDLARRQSEMFQIVTFPESVEKAVEQ